MRKFYTFFKKIFDVRFFKGALPFKNGGGRINGRNIYFLIFLISIGFNTLIFRKTVKCLSLVMK